MDVARRRLDRRRGRARLRQDPRPAPADGRHGHAEADAAVVARANAALAAGCRRRRVHPARRLRPTAARDFGPVLDRLDALDYRGVLSVEYFDLPENGWPLAGPEASARDLAAHLQSL